MKARVCKKHGDRLYRSGLKYSKPVCLACEYDRESRKKE
jgi:hypothetical protein